MLCLRNNIHTEKVSDSIRFWNFYIDLWIVKSHKQEKASKKNLAPVLKPFSSSTISLDHCHSHWTCLFEGHTQCCLLLALYSRVISCEAQENLWGWCWVRCWEGKHSVHCTSLDLVSEFVVVLSGSILSCFLAIYLR